MSHHVVRQSVGPLDSGPGQQSLASIVHLFSFVLNLHIIPQPIVPITTRVMWPPQRARDRVQKAEFFL